MTPSNHAHELAREITGSDAGSFARYTLDHRFPHIIDEVIACGALATAAVERLNALKAEVVSGNIVELQGLEMDDAQAWQNCLRPYLGRSWYEVPFLFAELYFYRRIFEAINTGGAPIDPFCKIKQQSLRGLQELACRHATALRRVNMAAHCDTGQLAQFVLETIWSNRNDLSQMPGDISPNNNSSGQGQFDELLLINELPALLTFMERQGQCERVDIVLDNCGHELLADLALVTFLLRSGYASRVYLHCKKIPVFVSDATVEDVEYMIQYLNDTDEDTAWWGRQLQESLSDGRLQLCDHPFWSLPQPFREMPEDIRARFQSSALVVLKGDANYRRLVDDRYWPHKQPFASVISYFPSNCVALRVLKSEVLVGLKRTTDLLPDNWMTNGEYGLIQFYSLTV